MRETKKFYDFQTVRELSGIQVSDEYIYELVELSINDLDLSNFLVHLDYFKEDLTVSYLVNRLELGGTLPPIILFDNMNVADGTHRVYAYMINNTKSFFALIKRPINDAMDNR